MKEMSPVVLRKNTYPLSFDINPALKAEPTGLSQTVQPEHLEDLERANRELKILIDSMHEVLFTIDVLSAKLLQMSAACQKIYGYPPEAFINDIHLWQKVIHPLDKNVILYTTEKIIRGEEVIIQHRIIRKDGEVRWVEAKLIPMMNDSGRLSTIHGIVRDITKEKKASQAVMESELLFRQFFETAPEAILVLDVEKGTITDYNDNALRLLKCTGTHLLTQTPTDLSAGVQPDGSLASVKAKEYIRQTMASEKPIFEWLIKDAQGNCILCEVRLSAITALGRKMVRASVIDITDRKEKEMQIISLNEGLEERVKERTSELLEANNALEAFSYSVSHDLRAPVRTMIGFTKIIRSDFGEAFSPELMEMFGHIESSARRMNAIIDDLLTLSKYEKQGIKPAPVDLYKLVNNVWDEISFNTTHHAKLQLHDMPVVTADASMLEQVMVNLISNAVKYSSKKEHPLVSVGCEKNEGSVTVFVRDNGAGFDMKNYNRLFSAFQRLHGMSEFEGTGVGLVLVKRIIERHSGIVWGEGKVNEGATFYFTLPVNC